MSDHTSQGKRMGRRMWIAASAGLLVFATLSSARASPDDASPAQPAARPDVVIRRVAEGPDARLSGEIVAVRRAGLGSGYLWVAHALSIRTGGGLRDAYLTSGDPGHDVLPVVGDRCDLDYRVAQTSAGQGPLVDRLWCNGRELRIFR